jgi:hypothetical protein
MPRYVCLVPQAPRVIAFLSCALFSNLGARGQGRLRAQFKQGSIAFGPQHPAAHGILKLQMQLQGEVLR